MSYLIPIGAPVKLSIQARLPEDYNEVELDLTLTSRFTGRTFEIRKPFTVVGSWIEFTLDAIDIPTEDDDYSLELVSLIQSGLLWDALTTPWILETEIWPEVGGAVEALKLADGIAKVQGNETFTVEEFESTKDIDTAREFTSDKDADVAREFESTTDDDTKQEYASTTDEDNAREFTSIADDDQTKSYK